MPPQMIFELVDAEPIPRLPTALDGTPRVADGVRYLTLEQAATRANESVDFLRKVWMAFFADMGEPQTPPLASTAPAAPAVSPPMRRVAAARLDVLRIVDYPDFTDTEWELFIEICNSRRLNPLCRQVRAVRQADPSTGRLSMSIITTIAAFRLIAERTGKYAGQTEPEFCSSDGDWKVVWPDDVRPPFMARVGILRHGSSQPIYGHARWREFAPYRLDAKRQLVLDPFWEKMPCNQLAKCAEAGGFRKAFAEDLGGLYTFEELASGGPVQPRDQPDEPPAIDSDADIAAGPGGPESAARSQLARMGYADAAAQNDVIEAFRREHGSYDDVNEQRFYQDLVGYARRRRWRSPAGVA